MTVLDDRLDEQPAAVTSAPTPIPRRSSVATWRLAARLARRETRRRPGRTALAAFLIAVPVAAMTLGSVFVRTEGRSDEWAVDFSLRYGDADVVVDHSMGFAGPVLSAPTVAPPRGTEVVDYLWFGTPVTVPGGDPGQSIYVTFTDMPLDDPRVAPAVEILAGRAPRPGEVLLDPAVAEQLDIEVGDTFEPGRPSGSWVVSGIGRYRSSYWEKLVVVPGFDRDRVAADARTTTTRYYLPDSASAGEVERFAERVGGVTRSADPFADSFGEAASLAWGWVFGVLALVLVGIIVAAAFATSARRQLVSVGQLSSNGASAGVIRRMLALQGTWTALAGTAVGMVCALAALPFLRGVAQALVAGELPASQILPADLAGIALTALLAGTIAAAVPARALSRTPVMAALAGRRPLPAPPRWLVPTGVALVASGLGLLGVGGLGSRTSASGVWALVIIVAVVAIVFGMVCATPLVVEATGRLASHVPLSPRLALRSMVRARTRSAAAVAAIAVAVGGAVAGAAIAELAISDGSADVPMPADTVVVERFGHETCCEGVVDAEALPAFAPSDDERRRLDVLIPDAAIEPLLVATLDPPAIDYGDNGQLANGAQVYSTDAPPIVATPAMLAVLGLDEGALDTLRRDGVVIGFDRYLPEETRSASRDVVYPTENGEIRFEARSARRPAAHTFGSGQVIVTPDRADELGFTLVERGVIVRSAAPLTNAQRDGVQRLFEVFGGPFDAFIEPGDPPRVAPGDPLAPVESYWSVAYDDPRWRSGAGDLWLARALIFVAAVLLSSLVIGIGLSLAAAEGREERDMLIVAGATPASMRRQAAARAWTLALTGIVLGIPTGFVPTWLLWRVANTDPVAPLMRFPWLVTAALLVALPLIVAAVAWSGSAVAQRLRPVRPTSRD